MLKVNIIAAEMSRERFKEAQDICNQNALEVGAKMFQDYIELYEHYIENYDKLGGPSSW